MTDLFMFELADTLEEVSRFIGDANTPPSVQRRVANVLAEWKRRCAA